MPATSPEAIARKRERRREVERAKRYDQAVDRTTRWVAIDGEAMKTVTGAHRYCLICTSAGDRLATPDAPLSTAAILGWLCGVFKRHKRARFIGFYLDYDFNHWFRDIPQGALAELWGGRQIDWEAPDGSVYALTYRPGVSLEIGLRSDDDKLSPWGRIEDVRGWMSGTLIVAVEEWGVKIPEVIKDQILRYKQARGEFRIDDIEEIAAYCLNECIVLTHAMARIEECVRAIGCKPSRWNGPGSAAASLMRQNGVREEMVQVKPELHTLFLHAYFGGRVAAVQIGLVGDVITWDMRSAYPWALSRLPTMRGRWEKIKPNGHIETWGLYRVRWDITGNKIAPFPFRVANGEVHWPSKGEGVYWSPEVAAAKRMYGDHIEVLDGWRFIPIDDTRPFDWLPELYRYRRQVERSSPHHANATKLVINAIAGKTMQGRTGAYRAPELQSMMWGGLCTSIIRSKMLDAAAQDPDAIVLFQVDSITATRELSLPIGPALGQWREISRGDGFVISSGVLHVQGVTAKAVRAKSRGIAHNAIHIDTWTLLRYLWQRDGWEMDYKVDLRRFIGLGSAIGLHRWDLWRSWITIKTRVSSAPTRYEPKPLGEFSWQLYPAIVEAVKREGVSKPYAARSDLQSRNDIDSPIDFAMEREQPVPTLPLES